MGWMRPRLAMQRCRLSCLALVGPIHAADRPILSFSVVMHDAAFTRPVLELCVSTRTRSCHRASYTFLAIEVWPARARAA
ncbi:hypothetical protein CALCODRAFT_104117 [Calocera cornea HHB12733]|uniref:Secreted protein n=1 Tax=Calocera cornea HHB12733 TaxID=1353952 RepID=A0A165D4H7_9BASI|nr:hypothetical protein CALCODRAFT_104117 [Calocera cornea HHB12733]